MTRYAGGCLAKVDSSSLTKLLSAAGIGPARTEDFLDAHSVALPNGSDVMVSTVDLVYDFGLGSGVLGSVAVSHALSDVFAVLASPILVNVCLGVRESDLVNGEAARMLGGARSRAAEEGVLLAGGHTAYSAASFVAVSAIGLDPVTPQGREDPQAKFELLLSKPIGSGIYLAAHQNSVLGTPELAELTNVLEESNAQACMQLRKALLRDPAAVAFTTDVTGFGLLSAIRGQTKDGWQAQLSAASVPILVQTRTLLEEHGSPTTLGEQNMILALEDPKCNLSTLDVGMQLVLTDPQTNGGLLAAVRTDLAKKLVEQQDGWVSIGTFETSTTGLSGLRVDIQ